MQPSAHSSPAAEPHARRQVDITSDASVEALYATVGRVDAIVSTAGGLFFGPLVALAYVRSVEGPLTGRVFRVWHRAGAHGWPARYTRSHDSRGECIPL